MAVKDPFTPTASSLKYVLRLNIGNEDTLAVIQHMLENPEWSDTNYLWPGVTFGMDTVEAQALLGSINGSGIGWLLIKQVILFYPS
jgi:hypothetical protein